MNDSVFMKNRVVIIVIGLLFKSPLALAGSMYDRRTVNGRLLFDTLVQQGTPRDALDRVFRIFDYNQAKIPNTNFAVIIDYSLPSTMKRLILMDFNTGQLERFYVAHGIRSGVIQTRSFANIVDSWKSSLGFYYAKGTYQSAKNGLSMYLVGIDRSNNRSKERTIVIHGAKYVSDDFIFQNGRLGWSEGCPAVALDVAPRLISILKNGSVVLAYHQDLMVAARQYPDEQDLSGEEILPPGVNIDRTPGEGGAIPPVKPTDAPQFDYISPEFRLD